MVSRNHYVFSQGTNGLFQVDRRIAIRDTPNQFTELDLPFVKMLRITDAEQSRVVNIPLDIAQHIGAFKGMMESVSADASEPVLSPAFQKSRGSNIVNV